MSDDHERPQTEDPMTDTSDTDGEPAEGTESAADRADEQRGLRRTLNYAILGGLFLLALIATIQLYINVSSAINQWITDEYRSLFQAAFNLTVLLLVGAAMIWQVRRVRS